MPAPMIDYSCPLEQLVAADPNYQGLGCGRGAPFKGPYKGPDKQCSACWLWENFKERHRALWSGQQLAPGEPQLNADIARRPILLEGVGTEMEKVLAELGLKDAAPEGCGCEQHVQDMNYWGPLVCRENREIIAGWLEESAQRVGWIAKARALTCGLAASVTGAWRPRAGDPFGSLVDEAIRRAESKAAT